MTSELVRTITTDDFNAGMERRMTNTIGASAELLYNLAMKVTANFMDKDKVHINDHPCLRMKDYCDALSLPTTDIFQFPSYPISLYNFKDPERKISEVTQILATSILTKFEELMAKDGWIVVKKPEEEKHLSHFLVLEFHSGFKPKAYKTKRR